MHTIVFLVHSHKNSVAISVIVICYIVNILKKGFLCIYLSPLQFKIDINGYLLPTFRNLTQLTFGGILNLQLLADLLQCSPILEVLILKVYEIFFIEFGC